MDTITKILPVVPVRLVCWCTLYAKEAISCLKSILSRPPGKDKDYMISMFAYVDLFQTVVGVEGPNLESTYDFQRKLGELLTDLGLLHLRALNQHPELKFSPNYPQCALPCLSVGSWR